MHRPTRLAAGLLSAAVATSITTASLAAPSADAATRPSLSVSATKARVGAAVYATADVSPVVPGGRVELQRKVGDTWIPIDVSYQQRKRSVRVLVPTVPGSHVFRLATTSGTTRAFKLRVPSDPGTVLVTREFAGENRPADHDMSATGRFIVDVEPSDEDPTSAVRVFDRVTGERRVYPRTSSYTTHVDISGDGNTIVFANYRTATVIDRPSAGRAAAPGDRTASIAPGSTDTVADYDYAPTVSANGRFVAFSRARVDASLPYLSQVTRRAVVVWDRADNSVRELPGTVVTNPGGTGDEQFYTPIISADGNVVAVNRLNAPALLWDRATDTSTTLPGGLGHVADLGLNGRFVVAGLGTASAVDDLADRFLLDRGTGTIKRIRLTGTYRSWKVRTITDVTENGRFLTVEASRKGRVSVFRYDRVTKKAVRASVSYKGDALNRSAGYGVTSESGRLVSFRTRASDVTPMQRKQKFHAGDVFLRFTR